MRLFQQLLAFTLIATILASFVFLSFIRAEAGDADVTRDRNLPDSILQRGNADVIRDRNSPCFQMEPNDADTIRNRNMQAFELLPLYSVSFIESGLPPGKTWSVTLDGVPQSTSDSQISFTKPNGQYSFSVTSTSGLLPSPTSEGTVNIQGDTTVEIDWTPSAQTYDVIVHEIGLPAGTSWSTTYGPITKTDVSTDDITFWFPAGGYSFSASSSDYTAEPSSIEATTKDVVGWQVTTNVMFFPNSNSKFFTSWNSVEDSYSIPNPPTSWSASGNCFGFSSTALLYFEHYTMSDDTSPFFPMQPPDASSTLNLDLGGTDSLNNASLATMIHQKYDPQSKVTNPDTLVDQEWQFEIMDSYLGMGIPAILGLWNSTGGGHAVVAWGDGKLQNGNYAIALYDPNYPEVMQIAFFNPTTKSFSYDGGTPFRGNGPFDHFIVRNPALISMSWFKSWWDSTRTVKIPNMRGYTLVVAKKSADKLTVVSHDLVDYFTTSGDSQTFVCGIPDSSGIEEGDVQVYAIPSIRGAPTINDPGSNESTIFISQVSNQSGQFVENDYLVNATAPQAYLNFTVTPTDSGLSIVAGDTSLNATVTCFSSTHQGSSVSQVSNMTIDAMQTVNFTAPYVMSVVPEANAVEPKCNLPINVTIANSGAYDETFNMTVYANDTAAGNSTVIATFTNVTVEAGNSTTLTLTWDTTGLSGDYVISACSATVTSGAGTVYDTYATSSVTVQATGGSGGGVFGVGGNGLMPHVD